MLRMGLDRSAAALLVAQTDCEGGARVRELDAIVAAFSIAATEVVATEDPEEGARLRGGPP